MQDKEEKLLVRHLSHKGIDDKMVMGHPASLFVLFFLQKCGNALVMAEIRPLLMPTISITRKISFY